MELVNHSKTSGKRVKTTGGSPDQTFDTFSKQRQKQRQKQPRTSSEHCGCTAETFPKNKAMFPAMPPRLGMSSSY